MSEEIWKDVENFPSYEISTYGTVRNKITKIPLKIVTKSKKPNVKLIKDNKVYYCSLKSIFIKAFFDNYRNIKSIRHKDGDTSNFNLNNLDIIYRTQNLLAEELRGSGISQLKENDEEVWIEIFPGYYKVSSHGRVLRLRREIIRFNQRKTILPEKLLNDSVNLTFNFNGKNVNTTVGQIVAYLFVDNPSNYRLVAHKDGYLRNNHYKNLKWVGNPIEIENELSIKGAFDYAIKLSELHNEIDRLNKLIEKLQKKEETPKEEWKEFEKGYAISNLGRVKRMGIVANIQNKNEYLPEKILAKDSLTTTIIVNNKPKPIYIPTLMKKYWS